MQIFILLLAAGLLLLAAEIFLPGGILGIFGGLALVGAIIAGFAVFGPLAGAYIALAVILGGSAGIVLWIRYFPRTRAGRALTLSHTESDYKSADGAAWRDLTGKAGTAVTDLRPAGIARVDNRNFDVIAEGMLIERGRAIRVIKVDGNRIVVRQDGGQ